MPNRRSIELLRPYLEGEPNEKGEQGLHCLFHEDRNRSASINLDKEVWYCHVCDTGGSTEELLDIIEHGDPMTEGKNIASFVDWEPDENYGRRKSSAAALPSEGTVAGWNSKLLTDAGLLDEIMARRGLSAETLERFQIGWSSEDKAYTIPVRDSKGELVNVRFYQLDPGPERRKIWGVTGHNSPVLYPISVTDDNGDLIICEGEWDALVLLQHGFPAVTRTAAAKVWKSAWNIHFNDKCVYICHDMDEAGQSANEKVARELRKHAREIHILQLPYPVTPDHGKDISDFFLEDHYTAHDFKEILNNVGEGYVRPPEIVEKEYVDLNVLESFNTDQAGKQLRMRVTITGKRTPTFMVPKEAHYTCGQNAGAKCNICPMNEMGGEARRYVESHDPILLEMMNASHAQVRETLRKHLGAPKCELLDVETEQFRSIEELFVRPSVEVARINEGGAADYMARKIISVGKHDTLPNNTVEVVGSIFPNPKTQHNEYQAWELTKTETSIDRYEVTEKSRQLCQVFKPRPNQRPLAKLADIARDLSANVTKIYGRPEMHAMFDLVFHSITNFYFGGQLQQRGWLECLVVGDTRTGKSEAAQRLIQFYNAGELVSCESATFAGIVGGLQQVGSRGEWEITWGSIPLNDRRLVALDEISGLTQEQIAQMSSIRSSGEAQLTKIRSERTWARTRLVWLGNPRNGRMSDYTYGVQAIAPLIGNAEDIARFDLAMSVAANEVSAEEINKAHDAGELRHSEGACRELLLWAWSRKADQVVWDVGAEEEVYASALALGERYVENPPLVQAANARVKVARIAVALAARTYSSDDSGELVVVRKAHVKDAVAFIDKIYGMVGFGYRQWSEEKINDIKEAAKFYDDAKVYVENNPGLAKFLRSMGSFRRTDLEDMLNMSKETANQVINTLWTYRMIIRQGPQIKLVPLMHDMLREIK